MNKWYTKSVAVKAAILHILCFICLVVRIGITVTSYHEYKGLSFNSGLVICFINVQMLVFTTLPPLLCSSNHIVGRHLSASAIVLRVKTLEVLILFLFSFQFILILCVTRSQDKNVAFTIGILAFDVYSFCVAEAFRIKGLFNDVSNMPDFGYFKYVMAASVCTQYDMFGIGSAHFLVVLSVCVALTFMYGNYFTHNDPDEDQEPAQISAAAADDSITDDEYEPPPLHGYFAEFMFGIIKGRPEPRTYRLNAT